MLWTRPAAAVLPLLLSTALAVDTVVELGYQTYEGVAGDNGISQWLGMRYGHIPERFAAPEDPLDSQGETAPADVVCIHTGPNMRCLDRQLTFFYSAALSVSRWMQISMTPCRRIAYS
jgi:hypothetical protein